MAVSRITITTELPDDEFERAAMLTTIKPAIDALRDGLPSSAAMTHEIVKPRKPSKPRAPKSLADGKKKAA